MITSFLAGGYRWEEENPCLCSVGGAASECGMLPVQVLNDSGTVQAILAGCPSQEGTHRPNVAAGALNTC